MPFVRAIRLSIRAKVLLLALGLALPPLIIVSVLGLSSLDRARDARVWCGTYLDRWRLLIRGSGCGFDECRMPVP